MDMVDGFDLDIILADTFYKRLKGWTGIYPIPIHSWLWLTPCNSIHTFTMRESLSLVYLDSSYRLCEIVQEIKPKRFHACKQAESVLEARCMQIDELFEIIPRLVHQTQRMIRIQRR